MKNLKFLTALLVLFTLQSCENEEVNQFEEVSEIQETVRTSDSDKLELQALTSERVPEFAKGLEKRTKNSKIGWTSKTGSGSMVLDETRILKVTDSVGNNTYSARMYVSDTPYNVFYNVVAHETADGNMSEPMILRYEVDTDYYATYKNSSRKDAPFKGNLEVIAWDSFTKGSAVSGKAPIYQPCDKLTADGDSHNPGHPPNGGGNGRHNTDNSSGSGYAGPSTGGYGVYAVVTDSRGGRGTTGSVEVGQGRFGKFGTDGESEGGSECNDQSRDTGKDNKDCGKAPEKGDCPDVLLLIPVNEYDDHVHLEDEIKNPCIKNILKKLQRKDMQNLTVPDIGGLDGTGHLAQYILDLFDKSGNYDLTFKIGETNTNVNASTLPNGDGWGITLNENYVKKATKLAIARTIIHESTHAYINYTVKEKKGSDMFKSLQALHTRYSASSNANNLTQHQFISQYVDALATSLSVWDDRKLDSKYYQKLAWAGLESSDAYEAQTNKSEIQNAIMAEQTSNGNAEGSKCN